MKNYFDAFDQWILTDNWNINNWGMQTYYGFMAMSNVAVCFLYITLIMLININDLWFSAHNWMNDSTLSNDVQYVRNDESWSGRRHCVL